MGIYSYAGVDDLDEKAVWSAARSGSRFQASTNHGLQLAGSINHGPE